jgi:hypothetical protein
MRFSFFCGATAKLGPKPPHCSGLKTKHRHSTPGRTPLNEWSGRRRDLYLTTHRSHKRQNMRTTRGIRARNPSDKAAAKLGLRPHGYRYRVRHNALGRFIERTVSPLQGVHRQSFVENIKKKYRSPERNSHYWPHSLGNRKLPCHR